MYNVMDRKSLLISILAILAIQLIGCDNSSSSTSNTKNVTTDIGLADSSGCHRPILVGDGNVVDTIFMRCSFIGQYRMTVKVDAWDSVLDTVSIVPLNVGILAITTEGWGRYPNLTDNPTGNNSILYDVNDVHGFVPQLLTETGTPLGDYLEECKYNYSSCGKKSFDLGATVHDTYMRICNPAEIYSLQYIPNYYNNADFDTL